MSYQDTQPNGVGLKIYTMDSLVEGDGLRLLSRKKILRESQFVKEEFGIFFVSLLHVFGCTLRKIFSTIPFKPVCLEQGEDLGLVRDRREGAVREHAPAVEDDDLLGEL